MEDIDALKRKLVLASHIMAREGLAKQTGHITIRIPGTDRFLAPPRMSPALVRFEDVLTINLAGVKVDGQKNPNSETWIHTCIYRARPDVNSIAHTHSEYAVLLGIVGQVIRPVEQQGVIFADGMTIFMRPGLINKEELGTQVAEQLGGKSVIMLRGHGAIVVSPSVERTILAAVALEESARLQYRAQAIGDPLYYTPEELSSNFPGMLEMTDEGTVQVMRAWDYYASRAANWTGQ